MERVLQPCRARCIPTSKDH